MKPYPVFLIGLERRRCVVVGGCTEAARKIEGLLECGAAVTVIAPAVPDRVRELAAGGHLEWIDRDFRAGDLLGAFLVIATAKEPRVRERIWSEASTAGALVNVVDDTAHCNFIAGSVVRRGALTVALSTAGCAPALAVRLRERLERELGPEYAAFLDLLSELREPLRRRFPDFEQRRAIWYELVDSDVLDHVRRGRSDLGRRRAGEVVRAAGSGRAAASPRAEV
jgi:siroheme synthase-like protein